MFKPRPYTPTLGDVGESTRAKPVRKVLRHALRRTTQKALGAVRLAASPEINVFDIGDRLTIGRHTYGKPRIRWYQGEQGDVQIGAFCSIADDVLMTTGGDHRPDWPSMYPFRIKFGLAGAYEDGQPRTKGNIEIGNDVWIGRGVRILPGVTIGHGAVVGAYAVVSKDVRPYSIVVGNPMREVRRRFTDSQIDAMLAIAWWDWEEKKILDNVEYLNHADINDFIQRFG
jgi:acetyltransferase-like isoleucine patch superfamily enzyme